MNLKGFVRCYPEEVGIPSMAIMRLIDELQNGGFTEMHGIMIMRHDKVCAEGWWKPYSPTIHHALHSLSKTWTATAIGLCEYQGLLSVNDRVCEILPDKMPCPMSARISSITVRDIMTMSSGSETEKEDYQENWIEDFFARPFEHQPGTFWRYNSHATAILSAIVERITGKDMLSFLSAHLFEKIGVDTSRIMCYRGGDGTCLGGHGMFTCTEDNLRLMRLYMHGGVWDGERLLSETFVKEAISPLMDTYPAHAHTPWIYDNCCGYGYQIWRCRPEGSYRADGAYGQFSIVIPSLDLIVAINETGYLGKHMSHNDLRLLKNMPGEEQPVHGPQATLNAVFEILLPAISTQISLLPIGEDARRLQQRMKHLSLPQLGRNERNYAEKSFALVLTAMEEKISFSRLQGMNKYNGIYPGAQRILLQCANGSLQLSVQEGDCERTIVANMRGEWSEGELVYTQNREIVKDVVCTAWWEKDKVLQLSIRWIETETENRYSFTFHQSTVQILKWVPAGKYDVLESRSATYRIQ